MRRVIAAAACALMIVGLAGCGGDNGGQTSNAAVPRLSPENLISAETAGTAAGATLVMSEDGVVSDGNMLTVTYVSEPLGANDSVSVSIEQFSDTLSTAQIWSDYESNRIYRTDMEYVDGIGEDCYIAFPYINIYDRGCYIRISAGSGSDEGQKNMLINLGTTAAIALEAAIPADAVQNSNVIQ